MVVTIIQVVMVVLMFLAGLCLIIDGALRVFKPSLSHRQMIPRADYWKQRMAGLIEMAVGSALLAILLTIALV